MTSIRIIVAMIKVIKHNSNNENNNNNKHNDDNNDNNSKEVLLLYRDNMITYLKTWISLI